MEQYIGKWHTSGKNDEEISELIIEKNKIEFYRYGNSFYHPHTFLGQIENNLYKIYTYGFCKPGAYKSISCKNSYKVLYVLKKDAQQGEIKKQIHVKECEFTFPELYDWLYADCYSYLSNTFVFNQNNFEEQEVVLLDDDIKISLICSKNTPPKIRVFSDKTTDIFSLTNMLESIMEFWGLIIGYISCIENIKIITTEDDKLELFLNYDFSYNLSRSNNYPKAQIKLGELIEYFKNWFEFVNNEKFSFLRKMYFVANKSENIFLEDLFIEYVRILEGYHSRIQNIDEISSKINKDLRPISKQMKSIILTDEIKNDLEKVFEKHAPAWALNSDHVGDIANWIAKGYLNRISLESQLRDLDMCHYNLISCNAEDIYFSDSSGNIENLADETQIIDDVFKKIVGTRNYYAHYKADDSNIFNKLQMHEMTTILKAIIVMIFYSKMGMDEKKIKKRMSEDMEFQLYTKHIQ